MKVFDDITFSGRPEDLRQFIALLDSSAQIGPWRRDRESEESHAMIRPSPPTDRCYRTVEASNLPSVFLWLIARDRGSATWRVTNIVPTASNSSIDAGTYYSLLISFRDAVAPLAKDLGITISEPRLDVGPEYWLTAKQAELLHIFSMYANRSTRAGHPRDRERWNAFVIAVHRDGSEIGGGDLERILVEHEGWPEAGASELAILFDQERALLSDLAKTA